jgi:hypothetical protein
MKKLRKVNTAKRKADRKNAEKQLAEQTALMMKHPKECCMCKTTFERNRETVKTWHVTVREERVHLTCPGCWKVVNEVLETRNEN